MIMTNMVFRNCIWKFAGVLLAVLRFTSVDAQIILRQLSVNEGLSNYQVSDIQQDDYGFIWIATNDGLNRYDGAGCKAYFHNPDEAGSLSSNRIKTLYYDGVKNRLLVGTDGGGINVYDYASDSFKAYYIRNSNNDWLPENDIIDIQPENDGCLWVATRRFIFLVELEQDIVVRQAIPYPTNRVLNSLYSTESELFAFAKRRVICYRRGAGEYLKSDELVLADDVTINSVSRISGYSFLISTDKGLFHVRYKNGGFICRKESVGMGSQPAEPENIAAARIIGDTMYFIIKEKGLFCKDQDGLVTHLSTLNADFWKDNEIKSSFVDHANTLWLGSLNKGAGLIDLDHIKIDQVSLGAEDHRPYISDLMYDDDTGSLWIGTRQNGLYVRDAAGKVSRFNFGRGAVSSIRKFNDGTVKIVCDGCVYSCSDGRFKEVFPLSYDFADEVGTVFSVSEDSSGNMWLGCRKGIVCLNTGKYVTMETSFHLEVVHDGAGLWVCSGRNGLIRYEVHDNGEIHECRHYKYSPDSASCISSNTVMTLLETSAGGIYVGTERGLDRIDPETCGVERIGGGTLSSCRVSAIQEDSHGILWINTSKGIVRYNPADGEEMVFDSSDGLVSNFTTNASAISGEDVLFVGTNEGVASFCTTGLPNSTVPPKIAVSGFKVFGEDVLLDVPIMDADEIVLSYNQNSITFNLSVLSFGNPQKNRFSYRLLGYEDNWTTVGINHPYASYSKLKKGNYVFEFKGINRDGAESEETIRIKIRIRPAWWDTPLAYCIYALLVAVLLYFIVTYAKDRMSRKAEKEADEAKMKFYDSLTHELRTPLTLITAPLSELSGMEGIPENVQNKLSIMQRNSDRLTELLNKILELRKLDCSGTPLSVKYRNVRTIVDGIVQRFEPLAVQKHLTLSSDIDNDSFGFVDEDKFSTILVNLLSNAIKFTEQGGTVSVVMRKEGGNFVLDVKDTGIGIPEKNLAHIFERFYQVENKAVSGTGIGLDLAKSLAELHKGSLTVKSRLGEGSTFTFVFPWMEQYYQETEIVREEAPAVEEEPGENEHEEMSDTVTVMLVEDDIEMQEYVKSILASEYKVIVASDGKEGLDKALESMPDLIISDVMMPVMDGITMCRKVTGDQRTCHIPVILLTAKKDELSGLESGAVDYIMKPFVPQKLLLKVRNLLNYRKSVRLNMDSGADIAKRISEYSEKTERAFLQKTYDVVNEHVGDPDFSVTGLMTELGISKTQLHKKMVALTGLPPSVFIRNVRLDKAKEMLETGQYTITEVLYSVGFSSPSYFSKKFKERFDKLPSDILEGR